jgi:ankyrin repeat protein
LQDRFGISPLRIAAARGHLEVVQRLCNARAEVDQADLEGPGKPWAMAAMLEVKRMKIWGLNHVENFHRL